MPHRLARLKNPFYVIPFEVAFTIYLVINGVLTISSQSTVLSNLLMILGTTAFLFPFIQIIAGAVTFIGIGSQKANVEAGGLILGVSVLLIRAIAVLHDGPPHLDDLNALTIVVLLVYSAMIRLNHILIVNKLLKYSEQNKKESWKR